MCSCERTSSSALIPRICGIVILGISLGMLCLTPSTALSATKRVKLRNEAKEMFYHAYKSYMDKAYPADELMPLSCRGRYRGSETSRGDIDDAMGNFSLTLVDTLDTLMVVGDIDEFERACQLVIRDVSFDIDAAVSVFETNIRMIGGLLSGHVMAELVQVKFQRMNWYRGELLAMAKDLGYRLLPAFNTTTGLPHSRINLRRGMVNELSSAPDTCTACAGTMLLEFAALSRLAGEPAFEEKARRAMDALWSYRHQSSDLVGMVLNVHSGDWVRRDSGVGAGIDSYYEYLFKGHILLGDEHYLDRFNTHYQAVMKYIPQEPMFVDVHMHRPHTNARNFMDALLAFWPGLQVMKGDIKPAIETHEMLYQVMKRHRFLPEAFTTDFQVLWGQHPLRPEFLESTYLLYKATGDDHYLEVGEKVLNSLQSHARVECGFAAVKDVRTGVHEDRMDSFVLAETLKYLYLLFASPEDLLFDIDQFLLTTEAHFLPLGLARLSNSSSFMANPLDVAPQEYVESDRVCPNVQYLLGDMENIRRPLKNLVGSACPSERKGKRRLDPSQFQTDNPDHLLLLQEMGISTTVLSDGRLQLVHSPALAKNTESAELGLQFIQEMSVMLGYSDGASGRQGSGLTDAHHPPKEILWSHQKESIVSITRVSAGPAQFGVQLKAEGEMGSALPYVSGRAVLAEPEHACTPLTNPPEETRNKIVIVRRGNCMFIDKVRRIESAGGIGAVIIDNTPGTSSSSTPLFSMSDDGKGDDIKIPALFLYEAEGRELLGALDRDPDMDILLSHGEKSSATQPSGTTTTTRTLSSPQTAADRKESEGVPKEIVIEEGEGSSTERSIEELRKTTSSVLVSVDRNLKELLEQFPSKEGLASLPARPQTGGPPAGNGAEREAMYNQLQQALQQQSQLESLDKELQRLKAISNLDVEEMASLERLQEEFKRLNDELEHLMSDILQARETKEPVKNDEL